MMRLLMQTCFECIDPGCALTVSLLRKPRLREEREALLDVAPRRGHRRPSAFEDRLLERSNRLEMPARPAPAERIRLENVRRHIKREQRLFPPRAEPVGAVRHQEICGKCLRGSTLQEDCANRAVKGYHFLLASPLTFCCKRKGEHDFGVRHAEMRKPHAQQLASTQKSGPRDEERRSDTELTVMNRSTDEREEYWERQRRCSQRHFPGIPNSQEGPTRRKTALADEKVLDSSKHLGTCRAPFATFP